ncbi:MAG: hypothetical protein AABY00_01545 [Nanoarchaeota archaeon]
MNRKGISAFGISILIILVVGVIIGMYMLNSSKENISQQPQPEEIKEPSTTIFLSSGLCFLVSQTSSSTESQKEYQCNRGEITPQVMGVNAQVSLSSDQGNQGIVIDNVSYIKKELIIQGDGDNEISIAFDCNNDRIFSDALVINLNQFFDFSKASFIKEKCAAQANILLKPAHKKPLTLTNIKVRSLSNSNNIQFAITNISFTVIPSSVGIIKKGDESFLEFRVQRDKDSVEIKVVSLNVDMEDEKGQTIRQEVDLKVQSLSIAPQKISVLIPKNIESKIIQFGISYVVAMPDGRVFTLHSFEKNKISS